MPIENPQDEQSKKRDEIYNKLDNIDNKLDNIDNKLDQKNDEFFKEMESVKNEINDLSKEYNIFNEALKTSFNDLKRDYNDLFLDATINNQSYYSVDKLESLKYDSDEVFNKNEALFNSIHANWMRISDASVRNFKNIIKDYAEKNGQIN